MKNLRQTDFDFSQDHPVHISIKTFTVVELLTKTLIKLKALQVHSSEFFLAKLRNVSLYHNVNIRVE